MATITETAKEWMMKIVQDQPADSTYEELLREIALARMIERGLADADAGRTITHDQLMRRVSEWQK